MIVSNRLLVSCEMRSSGASRHQLEARKGSSRTSQLDASTDGKVQFPISARRSVSAGGCRSLAELGIPPSTGPNVRRPNDRSSSVGWMSGFSDLGSHKSQPDTFRDSYRFSRRKRRHAAVHSDPISIFLAEPLHFHRLTGQCNSSAPCDRHHTCTRSLAC